MLVCPECGREDLDRRDLCWCGADVSLLSAMEAAVDAWHNAGLAAARVGDFPRALEWFAACAVARPGDATVLTVLAQLWLRLGHAAPALDALDRADQLEYETAQRSALRARAMSILGKTDGSPACASAGTGAESKPAPAGAVGSPPRESTTYPS